MPYRVVKLCQIVKLFTAKFSSPYTGIFNRTDGRLDAKNLAVEGNTSNKNNPWGAPRALGPEHYAANTGF